MNETLEKIRSRGYWRVKIRPDSFDPARGGGPEGLESILNKTAVRLRGWDFPHLGQRPLLRGNGNGWVGQETDWEHYRETWRLYPSGQFIHHSAMKEDWQSRCPGPCLYSGLEPGEALDPLDALLRCAEIFEFAARLLYTPLGDSWTHLEITLHGLAGRRLWAEPNRICFPEIQSTTEDKWRYRRAFPFPQLNTDANALALDAAQDLFQHFGWQPSRRFLRDMQLDRLPAVSSVGR